jgi:hypothetical protein
MSVSVMDFHDREEVVRDLSGKDGFGRGVMNEIDTRVRLWVSIVHAGMVDRIATDGISPERRERSFQRDFTAEIMAAEDADPFDLVLTMIGPRDAQVLTLRHGLDGGGKRILKDVGVDLGVSSSRVTQIENRAERRMKHPALRVHLKQYLHGRQAAILKALGVDADVVPSDVSRLEERLTPRDRLALKVSYGGLRDWLETCCQVTGGDTHQKSHGTLLTSRDRWF